MRSVAPAPRRLRHYFTTILRRMGSRTYLIDFDVLAGRLKLSRRSIERGVATLRAGEAFNFLTFRVGRSYAVKVSDRHRSIKGVFPRRGKRKETPAPGQDSGAAAPQVAISEPTEGCPPSRPQADRTKNRLEVSRSKIAALAACLARGELADRHWDNCKITWRFAHAFRFARRALTVGHSVAELVRAYDAALHQRHKDATDYGLNRGCVPAFWEPSSTVTLAAEMLRQDGRTVEQRWREFFAESKRLREKMAAAGRQQNVNWLERLETALRDGTISPAAAMRMSQTDRADLRGKFASVTHNPKPK